MTFVGIPREAGSERRVAITPASVNILSKLGLGTLVEAGAGEAAGYPDEEYIAAGAEIAASRADVFARADIIAQVRTYGDTAQAHDDLHLIRAGQIIIGFASPLTAHDRIAELAQTGASLLAMELVPRITRAQSMDALSSMANIAGYKAVLVAASASPRIFPMMTTAAGTVPPAKVFVIGGGVAGLQAIATARRLGAVVSGYDVRTAVKEQVESLGAKFVLFDLDENAEGAGGYAKELSQSAIERQRNAMAAVLREHSVVITTASVPGAQAPLLITKDMVHGMKPGSVIIDLAAERGGNCELTRADETVVSEGVTILGPTDLPSATAYQASQLYGRNIANLLKHLVKNGALQLDLEDEIMRAMLVAQGGRVRDPRATNTQPKAESHA